MLTWVTIPPRRASRSGVRNVCAWSRGLRPKPPWGRDRDAPQPNRRRQPRRRGRTLLDLKVP
eukprot:1044913-Prorocentrum_minimum.AAC.1